MGRWTQRARELQAQDEKTPRAPGNMPEGPVPADRPEPPVTPLLPTTVTDAPAAPSAAPLADDDPAVLWRAIALRPRVARLGPLDPIRLPAVRDGVPPLVSQDPVTRDYTYHQHCGSCGEPRETGQIFHCRACQRAHHLVLLELREGVPVPNDADAETEESRGAA